MRIPLQTQPLSRGFQLFILLWVLLPGCSGKHKESAGIRFDPIKPLVCDAVIDGESGKRFDILGPATTGIDMRNEVHVSPDYNFWIYNYLFNGAGLAIADFNGDELPDIWLCGNTVDDRLYLNRGDFRFEGFTEEVGIKTDGSWSTGATAVDINADGWTDVYVSKSYSMDRPDLRRNQLYVHQGLDESGQPVFEEMAAAYGLDDSSYTTHANFFDMDGDGDLDCYLLNHPIDFHDRRKLNNHEKIENSSNQSDKLYRNDGNGRFTDVSTESGIVNHGYGLGSLSVDFDEDGDIDLYVSNDWGMQDHLYLNDGKGHFTDVNRSHYHKVAFSSMGVDAIDLNRDGYQDLIAVEIEHPDHFSQQAFSHNHPSLQDIRSMDRSGYHYQVYRNTLQLNTGDGRFREVAWHAGVANSYWSWSPLFGDFDNDGFTDLFVSNGFYRRKHLDENAVFQQLRNLSRRQDTAALMELFRAVDTVLDLAPNTIYQGGEGLKFEDRTIDWGTNLESMSYGAGYADFDNDGDLDLLVQNNNLAPLIYRNNSDGESRSLRISLNGPPANPDGFGAKLRVQSGGRIQYQVHTSARGYQSSSEQVLHFGLGEEETAGIMVEWPDGRHQFKLAVNTAEMVFDWADSKAGEAKPMAYPQHPLCFEELTGGKTPVFVHRENRFDDFYRNHLVPRMYSRQGPAIETADLDGDGLEDFVCAGAAGQPTSLYFQESDGSFELLELGEGSACEDAGFGLFDLNGDGLKDIYAVSGGSDFPAGDSMLADRMYLNLGKRQFRMANDLIPFRASAGTLAKPADFDGDGDTDLFVGGGFIPDSYPFEEASVLLRNESGKLRIVDEKYKGSVQFLRQVNTAEWFDADNDGDLDLLTAGEWNGLRILYNEEGWLMDRVETGLDLNGWWYSTAIGDFDGDGDIDFAAGNHGSNFRFEVSREKPLHVWGGHIDTNESHDILMAYTYAGGTYPVNHLDEMSRQFPDIKERFPNYSSFATAEIFDIFNAEELNPAYADYIREIRAGNIHASEPDPDQPHRLIQSLESVYAENQGDGTFLMRPLPEEAQLAPLTALVAADFNGDGHTDLLGHGNIHDFRPIYEQQDACTGLLLLGDGAGGFEAVPSLQHGFFQWKEGRGLRILKTAKGGRLVLAGVNNDSLRIYKSLKPTTAD